MAAPAPSDHRCLHSHQMLCTKQSLAGLFLFLDTLPLVWSEGGPMAYYKVRIEIWCDWNPAESDVEEIGETINAGEAICTKREVVAIVDRPARY
jgi:hypothetical protein